MTVLTHTSLTAFSYGGNKFYFSFPIKTSREDTTQKTQETNEIVHITIIYGVLLE